MRSGLALVAALTLVLAACGGNGDDGGTEVAGGTATIVLTSDRGGRTEVAVDVARTAGERNRGLMGREELPEDGGMLFVFPQDTQASFWMKDTLIPLSIAFIAADGAILGVQDMEPLSMELHGPPGPYRYALEVNQGWFGRNGIGAGGRAEIPERVTIVPEGE